MRSYLHAKPVELDVLKFFRSVIKGQREGESQSSGLERRAAYSNRHLKICNVIQ